MKEPSVVGISVLLVFLVFFSTLLLLDSTDRILKRLDKLEALIGGNR